MSRPRQPLTGPSQTDRRLDRMFYPERQEFLDRVNRAAPGPFLGDRGFRANRRLMQEMQGWSRKWLPKIERLVREAEEMRRLSQTPPYTPGESNLPNPAE